MKICLLAAGRGTRMGQFKSVTHKGLLPLGNRAVISRIMDQFGMQCEFVVAVGHRQELIRDYLMLAHPGWRIHFVDVENFAGLGSGPGCSLYACREQLNEPFYFTACDTLIPTPLPKVEQNWMGVQLVTDIWNWCSVTVDAERRVHAIHYKEHVDAELAFVGLAFVQDHELFWHGMATNQHEIAGEFQVNNGLAALIGCGLTAIPLEWWDAGNEAHYQQLLSRFDKNYSFVGKTTDITYRVEDRVIKFFDDPDSSRMRYQRGIAHRGVFADVLENRGRFFSYRFAEGQLLSEVLDAHTCRAFLNWAEVRLWHSPDSVPDQFEASVRRFYQEKTLHRLEQYRERFLGGEKEGEIRINGISCAPAVDMVRDLGTEFFSNSIPSTFHGDLHPDNIVINPAKGFVLIDWRQSFGNLLVCGDRYYDLAKFLHVLELSVQTMEAGQYLLQEIGPAEFQVNHPCDFRTMEAMEVFWEHVAKQGYARHHILVLDALIFLNMAPLYEEKMARYLYHLGRYLLQRRLKG